MSAEILLADSNESIVRALGDYLEELGFLVRRVGKSSDALAAIQTGTIRLAIVATNLLEPSWEDVVQALGQSDPTAEVIIMVDDEPGRPNQNLLVDRAFDCLLKPFDERTLERAVRAALRKQDTIRTKDRLVKQLLSKTKRLEALVVEQEKRVAELESSRRQAEDTLSTNHELHQEVERLSRLVDKQDVALTSLRDVPSLDDGLSSTGTAPLDNPEPLPLTTSSLYLGVDIIGTMTAVLLVGIGVSAMTRRLATGPFAAEPTVIVQHTLLGGTFILGLTLLVRMHGLSSHLRRHTVAFSPPTRAERLLVHVGSMASIAVCVLGLCAADQFRTLLTSPATIDAATLGPPSITASLSSHRHRETGAMALVSALLSLIIALICHLRLIQHNFAKSLTLRAQKSSAQRRLQTL